MQLIYNQSLQFANLKGGDILFRNLEAEQARFGYTNQQTADKLGISRSYISRIENKALEVIKENFEKEQTMKKNGEND